MDEDGCELIPLQRLLGSLFLTKELNTVCLYSTWYQTRSRCQIDLKEFICLQKKQSIECVDVLTQVRVVEIVNI